MSIINSPGIGGIDIGGTVIANGKIEFTSQDTSVQFTVDPVTKTIDFAASGGGGGGAFPYKPEFFTLDSTDISNKFVTLAAIVGTANKTRLTVIGGTEQAYGDDFTVSGDVVSWNGTPLESLLASGDKIIIIYT